MAQKIIVVSTTATAPRVRNEPLLTDGSRILNVKSVLVLEKAVALVV